MVTEVSGNENKVKTSNKYEILSFDNSRNKDASDQCGTWSYLGIETFEFLAMGMLLIFLIYKTIRKMCGKDGILEKRREAKLQRDARRFERFGLNIQ